MLKRNNCDYSGMRPAGSFAGCSGTAGNNPFREETLLDKNWGGP